jgi:hypothetical protein
MDTAQREGERIKTRHLVLVISGRWVLMTVACFITTLRIDQFKNSLQDSAIKIVQSLTA